MLLNASFAVIYFFKLENKIPSIHPKLIVRDKKKWPSIAQGSIYPVLKNPIIKNNPFMNINGTNNEIVKLLYF